MASALGESWTRLQRGKILLDQRRYAQAEEELRQALAGDADRPLALYWLAWAQACQGKLGEAEANAGRSIAADPERAEGYHALAFALRKHGQLERAEEAGRRALEKDPHTVEYRSELAWILLVRKRPQEALLLIEHGLEETAEAAVLHRARTEALVQLGRPEEARASALHALSLAPEDATSRAQLGYLAFQKKNYAAAENYYADALRVEPGYSYARSGLLGALRHRYWYYRVLVPRNSAIVGRTRYALFYGLIGVGAAVRVAPALGAGLLFLLTVIGTLALVRWYLGVTVKPVTTLLLRLNPIGRAVIPRDDLECSDFAALLMGGAALAFLAAIVGLWHGLFAVGLIFMILLVPMTRMFEKTGPQRTLGEAYTWLLFSVGCGGIALLASKMYPEAAVAIFFCGVGALATEPITALVWEIMADLHAAAGKWRKK